MFRKTLVATAIAVAIGFGAFGSVTSPAFAYGYYSKGTMVTTEHPTTNTTMDIIRIIITTTVMATMATMIIITIMATMATTITTEVMVTTAITITTAMAIKNFYR